MPDHEPGGIFEMVLSTASIAGGALFAPIIWALYSKRQTAASVITASLCGLLISLALKLFGQELIGHTLNRVLETALGVGRPVFVLLGWEICYLLMGRQAPAPLLEMIPAGNKVRQKQGAARQQNAFGIKVIAASIAIVGAGICILGLVAPQGMVAVVTGLAILIISLPVYRAARLGANRHHPETPSR